MSTSHPAPRQSNFELLRIVCMVMIIAGHLCMAYPPVSECLSVDYQLTHSLRCFTVMAVNTFILISGYWAIRFKWRRLLKLDMATWFYSVAIGTILVVVGWHDLELKRDFLILFPVLSKQYWFITCYVMLYATSPLLNRIADMLTAEAFRRALMVGFLLFYVWPTWSYLVNAAQVVDDAGYGVVNFCYMYLLGRYLRLHYSDAHRARFYFAGWLLCSLALAVVQSGLTVTLGFDFTSFYSYNTIFPWAAAVFLFLWFKNIALSNRVVNSLASSCVAVYMIHLHPWLWGPLCNRMGLPQWHGWQLLAAIVGLPLLIYLVCAVLEMVRAKVFGPIEDRLISFLGNDRMWFRSR